MWNCLTIRQFRLDVLDYPIDRKSSLISGNLLSDFMMLFLYYAIELAIPTLLFVLSFKPDNQVDDIATLLSLPYDAKDILGGAHVEVGYSPKVTQGQ